MDRIENFFKEPSMSVLTHEQYPNYDDKWLGHTVLTASLLGLGGDVGVNWVLQNIKDPKKEYNNYDEYNLSPLRAAIDGNQPLPIIKTLVDGGAEINFDIIISVIWSSRVDVLKYFIKKDHKVVNLTMPRADGFNPLFLAIEHHKDDIVKLLIEKGAHVGDLPDNFIYPPHTTYEEQAEEVMLNAAPEDEAAATRIVDYIKAKRRGEFGVQDMFIQEADRQHDDRLGRGAGAGGRNRRPKSKSVRRKSKSVQKKSKSVRRKKKYMKKTRRVRRSRRRRK